MTTVDTGLDGVPVCASDISWTTVDAEGKPILLYRGYSIYDLAQGLFEESVYLLLKGDLPNQEQIAGFSRQMKADSRIKAPIVELMQSFPKNVQMMDFLFTALSYARVFDEDYSNNLWQTPTENPEQLADLLVRVGLRMGAKIPTLIAHGYRMRIGEPIIRPDPALDYAANFLRMLGIPADEEAVQALNTILILYLDHTINCSTFTAMVAESSGTDPYSPLLAGAASLKGVLHGGANERVADLFEEIGSPKKAADFIYRKLKNKERVAGFGEKGTGPLF